MLRALKRRIYRNRRRAVICFTGFFIMSVIGAIASGEIANLAKTLFVATALGIIMTTLLGLGAVVINRWRMMMELVGVASVVLAFLNAVWSIDNDAIPSWMTFVVPWIICVILGNLYGGKTLDKLTARRDVMIRAKARSPLPRETVWDGLFAMPDQRDKLHNAEDTIVYEYTDDTKQTLRIVQAAPDGMTQIEELQTTLLSDPPNTFKFRWSAPHATADTHFANGTNTSQLTDTRRGGTLINQTWQVDHWSSRMALFAWVDDHFGRSLDTKLATLEHEETKPSDAVDEDLQTA